MTAIKNKIRAGLLLALVITAALSCKKDNKTHALATANIYFQEAATKDTMNYNLLIDSNSIATIKLHPVSKTPATGTHYLTVAVDSSRLAEFQAKYGSNYELMPASYLDSYSKLNVPYYQIVFGNGELESRITNGNIAFTPVEINLVNENHLDLKKTYVLPVVINTIDDATNNVQESQVIYIVIRPITYKIDKSGWTVINYSEGLSPASGAIDGDTTTAWIPSFSPTLPEYFTVDMGQQNTISSFTYYTALNPPLQVEIYTSTDNKIWTDQGAYNSNYNDGIVVDSASFKYIFGIRKYNFQFKATITARYLKYCVISEYQNKSSFFIIYELTLFSAEPQHP